MKALMSGAAVAALVLGASATVSQAQTYDRLVVFGDSLSDNGNLYLLAGTPTSPPYWQGRFSDGPVFTEMLGFKAENFSGSKTGSINMAFSGALTGTSNNPPGLQFQLDLYQGAVPTLSPGSGKFGAGDLVSVLGGANNLLGTIAAAGASASPQATFAATAKASAAEVNGLVGEIAGMGAGTIMVVNLPQLSLTPRLMGTAGAPLADYGASTFNSTLATLLRGTAAGNPNSNIIQVDIYSAGSLVASDPGAFGLKNVTQPCFDGTTVCSNPGEYFYFDGIHPTTKGHAVLARLVDDYIYYGEYGSRVAVLGETAWRHREDDLDIATQALAVKDGWDTGTRLTFDALVDQVQINARGVIAKSKAKGYGLRLGLESASEDWRFGLAGTYRRSDVKADALKGDVDSYALDAYVGWRDSNRFANLAVGGAANNYRNVKRQTSLAPLVHESHSDGSSFGARLQGGMWFQNGGWDLSPRAALAWITTDVSAFQEQGAGADYQYLNRRLKAFTGEVTLRAEYDASRFGFYAEGGYRDTFSDDSEATRTGLVGNTAKVLSRDVDLPYAGQGLANIGLQGMLGSRIQYDVGYRGRFGKHFHSHLGGVQFTLPLQ